MIEAAFFAFLSFFAVLGIVHGFEETEAGGKKYRAAPVFPALLLFIPLALMLAFMVPSLGALVATAVEPRSTALSLQQNGTAVAVTIRSNMPATPLGELTLDWLYWLYILAAGVGPLAAYYAAYNTAVWLETRQTVPLFIRMPLVVFSVEEETEKPRPIEVVSKKKKKKEEWIILGGERW